MTTPSNGRSVVGFIGLGDQGLPMAEAIAGAGFPVHAWARRPEVWDDPRLSALTRQDSPEALAAAADILAVCVNTDATVLDLAASLLPAMRPGTVFVNHGTGTPANAVAMAELAARHGIAAVDAPVSGGRRGAEARTLTTLAAWRGIRDRAGAAGAPVVLEPRRPSGPGRHRSARETVQQRSDADEHARHQRHLTLAKDTGANPAALVDALRSGSASSRALELLGTMVRPETADHLSEVCVLDMEIFSAAMNGAGVHWRRCDG